MTKVNYVSLVVTILGALKVILQAAGYDVITDEMVNAIANVVASVAAVVGIFMTHKKPVSE